jgi:hypothetical protein
LLLNKGGVDLRWWKRHAIRLISWDPEKGIKFRERTNGGGDPGSPLFFLNRNHIYKFEKNLKTIEISYKTALKNPKSQC